MQSQASNQLWEWWKYYTTILKSILAFHMFWCLLDCVASQFFESTLAKSNGFFRHGGLQRLCGHFYHERNSFCRGTDRHIFLRYRAVRVQLHVFECFWYVYSWGWRHRPAAPFGLKSESARTSLHWPAAIMTPCWGCVDLGAMLDPNWAMLGPCWGYVELCWDHVGSCSVKIGARLAHFGGMLGLWLAERAYVGPFWSFVAHLGSMLGPSSPI